MANESDEYTLLLLREPDYIVATETMVLGILPCEKGSLFGLEVVTSNYFAIDIWANPC